MNCVVKILLLTILPLHSFSQTISTVAGIGNPAFSGDGFSAITAELKNPGYIIFDKPGNLYITDGGNRRIRKVNSSGIITTVAGNGTNTHTGDSGPATLAGLNAPGGITVDTFGNLYIAEAGHYIRKVNTSGIITTIAGTGTGGYNGDGIPAITAQLFYPYLGGVDNAGNIYFSDYNNHRVRRIAPNGIITTVAGDGTNADGGDGGPATLAQLKTPCYLTVHPSGDLYIPDNTVHKIRKVNTVTGVISTFAGNGTAGTGGDGGLATAAQLSFVNSIAFDNLGNAYIADRDANALRKIDPSGIISTVAGTGIAGYGGDGGPALAAKFDWPNAVAVNVAGNAFIADYNNHRIRKITYHPDAINDFNTTLTKTNIYPSPAKLTITIATDVAINNIALVNILGQTVKENLVAPNTKDITLIIQNLPPAIYFVKVNGVYAGKFLKE